jgi:hypothetical protein
MATKKKTTKKSAPVAPAPARPRTLIELSGWEETRVGAYAFEGRRWNGFLCPLFDKAGADALVAAFKAEGLDAYHDASDDTYHFVNQGDTPDDHDSWPSEMLGETKVWAIGAGCWTWVPVNDNDT